MTVPLEKAPATVLSAGLIDIDRTDGTDVKAWVVAGRPMAECMSLAGFSDWSALCRQPLLWLGLDESAQPTVNSDLG